MRDIAAAIGQRLDLPVVSISEEAAQQHFGWLAGAVGLDLPASGEKTKRELDWHPDHSAMVEDLLDAYE